jgi:NADH-quinone oxidoreductase subunit J
MVLVVLSGTGGAGPGAPVPPGSNTKALGRVLYTEYVYPFELAAVLLLVAIVAAIAITHRKRRETKYQDPGEQVKVRREDRVRLVRVPAEKRPG